VGLHELTLRHFRLFDEFSFRPDPDAITVFLSANGTGKTSVLEAVFALSTATSFRTHAASDMIQHGQSVAEIHGVIFEDQRRVQVDLTLTKGIRNTTKRMLINGQKPTSRAVLAQSLPLTVFTPEGVDVVRGGPEHRREYLTTLLVDVDPTSADVVERFARILSQRNALLRSLGGEAPSGRVRDELDAWTEDFLVVSDELVQRRKDLLGQLAPHVSKCYEQLAGDAPRVELNYQASWKGSLRDALDAALSDDRYRGYTTVGPHRDDITISLNAREARHQASQGEQRSLALALRLAGHHLVHDRRGVEPLLLLDDVFSELDPARSHRLLELLPTGQTLVTTASPLPGALHPAAVIDLTRVVS